MQHLVEEHAELAVQVLGRLRETILQVVGFEHAHF